MNTKRIVYAVVLVAFSALTAEAVIHDGFTGWLKIAASNVSAGLLLVDLTIALSFVMGWMIKDARARKVTVWPFAVLTVALGSVGPLAYLVLRSTPERRRDDAQERAPRGLGLESDEPLA